MKVISVDDYSESSANHSHDPSKYKAGGGNGGRKGWDIRSWRIMQYLFINNFSIIQ